MYGDPLFIAESRSGVQINASDKSRSSKVHSHSGKFGKGLQVVNEEWLIIIKAAQASGSIDCIISQYCLAGQTALSTVASTLAHTCSVVGIGGHPISHFRERLFHDPVSRYLVAARQSCSWIVTRAHFTNCWFHLDQLDVEHVKGTYAVTTVPRQDGPGQGARRRIVQELSAFMAKVRSSSAKQLGECCAGCKSERRQAWVLSDRPGISGSCRTEILPWPRFCDISQPVEGPQRYRRTGTKS